MIRLVALYNLKAGTSIKDFKKFAMEVDQKITPKQPGMYSWEAIEIKGTEGDGPAYQIMEIITVESWEVWQNILESDAMKPVTEGWSEYGDGSSVLSIYGDIIK